MYVRDCVTSACLPLKQKRIMRILLLLLEFITFKIWTSNHSCGRENYRAYRPDYSDDDIRHDYDSYYDYDDSTLFDDDF